MQENITGQPQIVDECVDTNGQNDELLQAIDRNNTDFLRGYACGLRYAELLGKKRKKADASKKDAAKDIPEQLQEEYLAIATLLKDGIYHSIEGHKSAGRMCTISYSKVRNWSIEMYNWCQKAESRGIEKPSNHIVAIIKEVFFSEEGEAYTNGFRWRDHIRSAIKLLQHIEDGRIYQGMYKNKSAGWQ
jgi:hypothetical protein